MLMTMTNLYTAQSDIFRSLPALTHLVLTICPWRRDLSNPLFIFYIDCQVNCKKKKKTRFSIFLPNMYTFLYPFLALLN